MKCPRCDQSVAFTQAGAHLRLFDAAQYATVVATVNEDGLIGDTHTGWSIKEHVCPDQEEPDIEELRDEWWVRARSAAYKFPCPEAKCMSNVGQPCMDMRFKSKEPRMQANWPHASRVAIALTPDEYDEGRKNGWIS